MLDIMGSARRTHYCGTLNNESTGNAVTVCGFVQRARDKGGIIFIDLRDRSGLLQLVFDETSDKAIFEKAGSVRSEYVLMASGSIRERSAKNDKIATGDVELYVTELLILSKADTPPFEISDDCNAKEELRLKHRYLDLRRPFMQQAIITRHKLTKAARDFYDKEGFLEIETPVMIKSTPEGARDYLVPSRVQQGKFFALPQSPQLYKQLLMLSGFDKYMQIARCFRDEDLRADRQPEFTQIDLEMSFVDADDVMNVNEGAVQHMFKEVLNADIPVPFPRMTYEEAMRRFGSDKPDTRFDMELIDLADTLKDTQFQVFSGALSSGGAVKAINAKGAAESLSRKEIDKLTAWLKEQYGVKGLAFSRILPDGTSSSFEKFLSEDEIKGMYTVTGAETGDVILVIADTAALTCAALSALRLSLGETLGLIDHTKFSFLWVTEFPLFEKDAETGRLVAMHHPFTSPMDEDMARLDTAPETVRAKAYDMVLNGCEVGGGSIRINNPEIQSKMFSLIGFSKEESENRFGFLLEAFKYGVPPHGGMAYGLDRLVMLMLSRESIRDVIAFPKVASSSDLMAGAPDYVDDIQLFELGIGIIKE